MRQAIKDWWSQVWTAVKDPETWIWTFVAACIVTYVIALLVNLG